MPPRSRRRAAQQRAQQAAEEQQDLSDEDELQGTVDLGEEAAEDIDFADDEQIDYADEDDVDFEALATEDDEQPDFESLAAEESSESEDFADFEEEASAPPAGRGSRRTRGAAASSSASARSRSSRRDRLASASERKKAAKKSRRQAKKERTPEEIAARRKAMKNGLLLTLLMVVLIGGAIGFYYTVMRTPPEIASARALLRTAENNLDRLELLINRRNPNAAEKLIDDTVSEYLNLEQFAYANEADPDPNNENLVSVSLAKRAYELNQQFSSRRSDVKRIREDIQARNEFNQLMKRLSDLSPESEPDLNELRADVDAFMDNPPDPDAGPDLNKRERYYNQFVQPVGNRILDIEVETLRRISAGTTDVVSAANQQAAIMMKDDRYGEALRLVDQLSRQNRDALLGPLRNQILDSARKSWESARNRARNAYNEARAAGSADGVRESALREAREILHHVETRFGEDVAGTSEIVREAKAMQSEFGF